ARAVVDTLMREVITLAQAEGINLKEQDLEVWPPVLNALSPVGKTSITTALNRDNDLSLYSI
ncbi:MAG: hypothetical protein R6W72_01685, partial [Desulfurivibrionaceae bacterium]